MQRAVLIAATFALTAIGGVLHYATDEPVATFVVCAIALGGLLYTAGMVLFIMRRPRLWPHVFGYHEVFHVLVVTASALHYAAIFAYVAPLTPH